MTFWPGYPPPAPPKPPWYRNLMVWLWVYVGFAVLAAAGFFGLFIFAGDFETTDSYYDDEYYYVEQESVNRAVAGPCDDMASAGQDIRVFSSNTEGAEALHRFVTAGQAIPEAINNVEGADGSALRWRSDWIAMLDALDSYANELADDPDAVFTVPTNGDGDPLTYSLAGVSEVPCEIPPAIMALDPEAADGPYYPSY